MARTIIMVRSIYSKARQYIEFQLGTARELPLINTSLMPIYLHTYLTVVRITNGYIDHFARLHAREEINA